MYNEPRFDWRQRDLVLLLVDTTYSLRQEKSEGRVVNSIHYSVQSSMQEGQITIQVMIWSHMLL